MAALQRRGFSPDFSVGTLDGVEQATTDDNRAVAYDQYPSELVGGVTVYKSGQADLVGGLAGTVDLETTSPLSASHRIIALSAFYNFTAYPELTPGVKQASESYSASYIDQFANGTEGVYVGYAHTEDPYEGKQFQAWGYPTDGSGNLVLGGMKIYDQSELLKRDAVIGVLESKPNDFIHSKIDLFYSKFNDNELLNGLQVPMAEWSSAQLQPGYTVTNGLVTNYTLKNAGIAHAARPCVCVGWYASVIGLAAAEAGGLTRPANDVELAEMAASPTTGHPLVREAAPLYASLDPADVHDTMLTVLLDGIARQGAAARDDAAPLPE